MLYPDDMRLRLRRLRDMVRELSQDAALPATSGEDPRSRAERREYRSAVARALCALQDARAALVLALDRMGEAVAPDC